MDLYVVYHTTVFRFILGAGVQEAACFKYTFAFVERMFEQFLYFSVLYSILPHFDVINSK